MKLGKLPPRHDERTLKLSSVFTPPIAVDFDWSKRLPVNLGQMCNDDCGDCTCAGAGHLVQTWTANNGAEVSISDDDILAAYKVLTLQTNGVAYDPDDPSTDTGLVLLDVLKYWRTTGIGGHKIGGFAAVNHKDLNEIRAAGNAFGGLYTGVSLPISAQAQVGKTWTPGNGEGDDAPGTWGGHCVAMIAANASGDGGVRYITWGKRQDATFSWVVANGDEMFAVFSNDWVNGNAPAPNGMNVTALKQYLASL